MLGQIESTMALPMIGSLLKLALLILLLFRRAMNLVVWRLERLDGQVADIDRKRVLHNLLQAGRGTLAAITFRGYDNLVVVI